MHTNALQCKVRLNKVDDAAKLNNLLKMILFNLGHIIRILNLLCKMMKNMTNGKENDEKGKKTWIKRIRKKWISYILTHHPSFAPLFYIILYHIFSKRTIEFPREKVINLYQTVNHENWKTNFLYWKFWIDNLLSHDFLQFLSLALSLCINIILIFYIYPSIQYIQA